MNERQHQRLYFLFLFAVGFAILVGLTLYALRSNINLYYTPIQIAAGEAPVDVMMEAGGLVKEGSVKWQGDTVHFTLTDLNQELHVTYNGMLPDLFREGQGIVAKGRLTENNQFVAIQILAKHDENYMPPSVARSIEKEQA